MVCVVRVVMVRSPQEHGAPAVSLHPSRNDPDAASTSVVSAGLHPWFEQERYARRIGARAFAVENSVVNGGS